MTTHHGRSRHTSKDREVDSHIEDTGGIDVGPSNDNGSTNSSDTTVAFGESDADEHLSNFLHSSQANITTLKREISSLRQHVEAGEGRPT